jgi:hypothetical protein
MTFTSTQIEHYYRNRMPRIVLQGSEWRGPCPVHDGKDNNFSIDPKTGQCYCHSVCQRGWEMTGLEMELSNCTYREALDRLTEMAPRQPAGKRKIAEYDYRDEKGKLLFQVVRFEGKTFLQRRPGGDNGNWTYNLEGVRRVIFRLPQIMDASPGVSVHIVEGEKDVLTLDKFDILATCNSGGAGKWRPEYSESLRGRCVVITPDNDRPGINHGLDAARSLLGVAGSVWWMPLPPEFKDVSEFFENGGSQDKWDDINNQAMEIRTLDELDRLTPKTEPAVQKAVPVAWEPEPPQLPDFVWTGIVGDYRDLFRGKTEVPEEFHLASLLTTVGCLVGRSVYCDTTSRDYANFFSLLFGPTAAGRKTTAIRLADNLAREVANKLGVKFKTLWGIASVEGLAEAMRDPEGPEPFRLLAVEDEFRSLIAKGKQKSVSNIVPRLTELYNLGPTFEVNTRANSIKVEQFFLSILSASTPEWFVDSLTDLDVQGGFLNRWCLFSGTPVGRIHFPLPPDRENWERIAATVAESIREAARSGGGKRMFSPDAMQLHKRFYEDEIPALGYQGLAAEATSRIDLHARKFALVFSVLERHHRVEAEDLTRGIAVAKYCAETAANITSRLGTTRAARSDDKLIQLLRREGPQNATQAMRTLRISAEELQRTARSLEQAGVVEVFKGESNGGRQPVILRLVA